MNDQQLLDLFREALFGVAPNRREEFADITLATTIDDLALDSIAVMEMVGFIEDRLDTTFPEEDLLKVKSLGDLAKLAATAGGVG